MIKRGSVPMEINRSGRPRQISHLKSTKSGKFHSHALAENDISPPPPPISSKGTGGGGGPSSNVGYIPSKKDSTLAAVQQMERAREQRRRKTEEKRILRAEEERRNIAKGNPGDIDFQRLIADFREVRMGSEQRHMPCEDLKICIAVRKRPVSVREVKNKDHDSVTINNPIVSVHNCKLKVDGITKYLDSIDFCFDHAFGGDDNTQDLYICTAAPLIPFVVSGGRATVFAYGQTGSGKTYTMIGIQEQASRDLFHLLRKDSQISGSLSVLVSFFEIYGGRCQDLLNNRHRVHVREDGQGNVHIAELQQSEVDSVEMLEHHIAKGNHNRTTRATQSNDTSSRSHAICQITLVNKQSGRLHGRLSLIDLAGSERGADTKSHNRQRRMEGAEINTSLLALKECIRALDSEALHVPYRASKLTLVLKDSFARKSARTVMIATVSPGASYADHTLNTLRYADRVKEKSTLLPQGQVQQGKIDERSFDKAFIPTPPQIQHNNKHQKQASVSWSERQQQPKRLTESSNGLHQQRRRSRPQSLDPSQLKKDSKEELMAEKERRLNGGDGSSRKHWKERMLTEDTVLKHGKGSRINDEGAVKHGLPVLNGDRIAKLQQQSSSVSKKEDIEEKLSSTDGSISDINFLHNSLRKYNASETEEVVELHRTVQSLFDEEEALLNLHMNVIQENAELLTEEGQLLQQIQGDDIVDYDIDAYASRLSEIMDHKMVSISKLQEQLAIFRKHLEAEEKVSKAVDSMPQY
eukprot:110184_1